MITIQKAQNILQRLGVECWLLYSAEQSDPVFSKLISSLTSAPALVLITPTNCVVNVHALDSENVVSTKGCDISVYKNEKELWELISITLKQLNFPKTISLNFSKDHDPKTDYLGVGTYTYLRRNLRKVYPQQLPKLVSAESVLYALWEQKDEQEVKRLRLAADRALEIIEYTFQQTKVGMTEWEIAEIARTQVGKSSQSGVVEEICAWESELCPIVLTGENLTKGGHTAPSTNRLKSGQTLYIDFGVTLVFKDGGRATSDLQRMAYVLDKNEDQAPAEVQKIFTTLHDAVSRGIEKLIPGVKGYEIDRVVRTSITKAGYPEYNHSTGHAVGEIAHAPGTLLGPKTNPLARKLVQVNGVYTIEPRIAISNGGSIEEMVLATEAGGIPLSKRQEELYLLAG